MENNITPTEKIENKENTATTPMSLQQTLKERQRGEVCSDENILLEHSRDTSLFQVMPQVVVYPQDIRDVQETVKEVAERKQRGEDISITARAAGTDMTGGPLGDSVILSFTQHMNHITSVTDREATAEAGVYYRDFEKATLERGWLMPSYPASKDLCAIGGIVMNNSGGEKTLTYGKTEAYVKKIETVLSNGDTASFMPLSMHELEEKKKLNNLEGDIYRNMWTLVTENEALIQDSRPKVSKNSAGYYLWNIYNKEKQTFDLSKVITGSQGTLVIMTSATLTGVPPKKHSRLVVAMLHDLSQVSDITNDLLTYKPETLESYDDQTLKVAIKFFPDIAKKLNGNMFLLAFQFIPEFFMVLTGGVPKLILMAEFTGDEEMEVIKRAQEAYESLKKFPVKLRLAKSEQEAKKYWTFRRESFNLLRQKMHGNRTAPFIEDIVINPNDLPLFLPELQALLSQYPLIYTIAGHVGNGNFHIIPLMDLAQDESIAIIKELTVKTYELVKKYNGSITGEHNDGILRTPFLNMMFNERMLELFAETKNIFDPYTILNPGKKVGGTWDIAVSHIDRSHDDLERRTYMPC